MRTTDCFGQIVDTNVLRQKSLTSVILSYSPRIFKRQALVNLGNSPSLQCQNSVQNLLYNSRSFVPNRVKRKGKHFDKLN